MKNFTRKLTMYACLIAMFVLSTANAQYNWTGGADTSWTNPGNWLPGPVPTLNPPSGAIITIKSGAPPYPVLIGLSLV